MLVIGLIVQVAAVLLDLVDAELGRVDRLDAQVEVLNTAIDLAMLLAVGALHPQLLHISALDDMVPVVALLVGLRAAEPGGLIKRAFWHEELDFIPERLGLGRHPPEGLLKALKRAARLIGKRVDNGLHGLARIAKVVGEHMLSLLAKGGRRGRRSSPEQDR